MEDDRKLCEYLLLEGATISALFEPDVDVDIEVSMGNQTQKITVSNTTTVMALKVQISGIMKCGVAPERLEMRLRDVTLEDPMPLHFYGIKDGSKLEVVKPYVRVRVENNKGDFIRWRMDRKDTIKEVKAELATSLGNVSTKQMHLYIVTDGQSFDELDDDDETVERCKIQEGDKLFLLTYRWMRSGNDVTIKKTGRKIQHVEPGDTCLGIKVKAQDQTGMPVSTIKLARLSEYQLEERDPWSYHPTDVHMFNQLIEIRKEEIPFNKNEPLSIVTEEELQSDRARVEEEIRVWREQVKLLAPVYLRN